MFYYGVFILNELLEFLMITSHLSKVRYKIQGWQIFSSFKTFLFLLLYVLCTVFVAGNVCHAEHMEARGQLCGVPFFHGIQGSNSGFQSCAARIFSTTAPSHRPFLFVCWTQGLRHSELVFYLWYTLPLHFLIVFQRDNVLTFVRI